MARLGDDLIQLGHGHCPLSPVNTDRPDEPASARRCLALKRGEVGCSLLLPWMGRTDQRWLAWHRPQEGPQRMRRKCSRHRADKPMPLVINGEAVQGVGRVARPQDGGCAVSGQQDRAQSESSQQVRLNGDYGSMKPLRARGNPFHFRGCRLSCKAVMISLF
jgi:hypothetical protein